MLTTKPFVTATTGRVVTPRSTGVGARPKCLCLNQPVLETSELLPADGPFDAGAPATTHVPMLFERVPVVLWDVERHLKRTDPPLRVHTTEQKQTKQRNVLVRSKFNSPRLQTPSYNNAPHIRDEMHACITPKRKNTST